MVRTNRTIAAHTVNSRNLPVPAIHLLPLPSPHSPPLVPPLGPHRPQASHTRRPRRALPLHVLFRPLAHLPGPRRQPNARGRPEREHRRREEHVGRADGRDERGEGVCVSADCVELWGDDWVSLDGFFGAGVTSRLWRKAIDRWCAVPSRRAISEAFWELGIPEDVPIFPSVLYPRDVLDYCVDRFISVSQRGMFSKRVIRSD